MRAPTHVLANFQFTRRISRYQKRGLQYVGLERLACRLRANTNAWQTLAWSAEDEEHGALPHHHLALFAGARVETQRGHSSHGGFAVGLEYEYRFHQRWGIGGVVEAPGYEF